MRFQSGKTYKRIKRAIILRSHQYTLGSALAAEDTSQLQQKVASTIGSSAFFLTDWFGWLATTILISTTTLRLSALGILWFLWEADHDNKTWHRIATKDWMTRTVALTSLVLSTSMSMQASAATSMLARLALENTQILLLHSASVSMMRNTNAGPYMLRCLIFKAFHRDPWRWRKALILTLILILVMTSTLARFTSTTLMVDLAPGTVPGHNSSDTTATDFHLKDQRLSLREGLFGLRNLLSIQQLRSITRSRVIRQTTRVKQA